MILIWRNFWPSRNWCQDLLTSFQAKRLRLSKLSKICSLKCGNLWSADLSRFFYVLATCFHVSVRLFSDNFPHFGHFQKYFSFLFRTSDFCKFFDNNFKFSLDFQFFYLRKNLDSTHQTSTISYQLGTTLFPDTNFRSSWQSGWKE